MMHNLVHDAVKRDLELAKQAGGLHIPDEVVAMMSDADNYVLIDIGDIPHDAQWQDVIVYDGLRVSLQASVFNCVIARYEE